MTTFMSLEALKNISSLPAVSLIRISFDVPPPGLVAVCNELRAASPGKAYGGGVSIRSDASYIIDFENTVIAGNKALNVAQDVAVRAGNVLGTSFHPELTDDARMHEWFLGL